MLPPEYASSGGFSTRETLKSRFVTVYEGGRVDLPPKVNFEQARRRLLTVNQSMRSEVFTIDRQGLRVGAVVGMVDIGCCQIEILPKVSAGSSAGENSRFLLNLLAASGVAPRSTVLAARVPPFPGGVLEAIARAFAEDLWLRLLQGPPRRYAEIAELLPVLRGRISFEAIVTRPPGNDQLLSIKHAPLQPDNILTRIIFSVTHYLRSFVRSLHTRRILEHCQSVLGTVLPIALTPELVNRVRLNRLETHWEPVLSFARALAHNRTLSAVSSGDRPFFSLVFTLDDLFETVLRNSLRIAVEGAGLSLMPYRPTLHLFRSLESGLHVLRMRPDYLFVSDEENGTKKLVGDAKWKRLNRQGTAFGLKPPDAYQLTAYMTTHNLQKGILFFPLDDWMGNKNEPWVHRFLLTGGIGTVTVAAVDVYGLVVKNAERHSRAIQNLRQAVLVSLEERPADRADERIPNSKIDL